MNHDKDNLKHRKLNAALTPSPLMGEGGDEGKNISKNTYPSPQSSGTPLYANPSGGAHVLPPITRGEEVSRERSEESVLKLSILKKRAAALAKEKEKPDANIQFLEIIEFRLALETYGVESKYIREIYPLKDFTPLPGTPSFVLGLANVRGQILSVIDLKKFFNLPEKGLGELNKIIIVRNELMEFGILADAIIGTCRVRLEDIQGFLPTVSGIGAEYLKGITKERVAVLDMEKILNDTKIIVNQH